MTDSLGLFRPIRITDEQRARARVRTLEAGSTILELVVELGLPRECFAAVAQIYHQQLTEVVGTDNLERLEARDAKMDEIRKLRGRTPETIATMSGGILDDLNNMSDEDLEKTLEEVRRKKALKPI